MWLSGLLGGEKRIKKPSIAGRLRGKAKKEKYRSVTGKKATSRGGGV